MRAARSSSGGTPMKAPRTSQMRIGDQNAALTRTRPMMLSRMSRPVTR